MSDDLYDRWGRNNELPERNGATTGPVFDVMQYLESGRSLSGRPLPPLPQLTIDRSDAGREPAGTDRQISPPPPPGRDLEGDGQGTRRLSDGATLSFDGKGRVIATVSADGNKMREVFYENPANESQVSRVIIDRQRSYVRRGDGSTWDVLVNGNPAGNWFGDIRMSAQGEYSFTDYTTGQTRRFRPDTRELAASVEQTGRSDSQTYLPEYRPYQGPSDNGGCWQGESGWDNSGCSRQISRGGGGRRILPSGCGGRGFPILRRIFGR